MSSPIARRLARYALRRASALAVADGIFESLDYLPLPIRHRLKTLAKRIRSCALTMRVSVQTPLNDATTIRASNKRACKIRLCPQCAYAAAARDRYTLSRALDLIVHEQPDIRAILLTLSTANRPLITGLKPMLRDHQAALKRFMRAKLIQDHTLGTFSSIELAVRGTPEAPMAGIHSHSILLVPPTYFATGLPAIHQRQFRDHWQKCARLSYEPIVDCRVVKLNDGSEGPDAIYAAMVECAKYCITPQTLFSHPEPGAIRCDGIIASIILAAFHRQRLHSYDRLFAQAIKRTRKK